MPLAMTEAIEAANSAIALDATNVDGYLVKGYALFRQAESAEDRTTAYAQARRPFLDLNKLENDHPIPLAYFYRSFLEQGQQPTENAINGLKGAVTIAPFDLNLRMMLATQQMQDKKSRMHRSTSARLPSTLTGEKMPKWRSDCSTF